MRERKEIYSYRKFKGIGLASVMIGLAFFGTALEPNIVHAASAENNVAGSSDAGSTVNKTVEKVRVEKIPVTARYVGNEDLDYGKLTEVPGEEGEKRITTIYTVDPKTGALTNPVDRTEIIKPMKQKVVTVGTKPVSIQTTGFTGKITYTKDIETNVGSDPVNHQPFKNAGEINYTFEVDEVTGDVLVSTTFVSRYMESYFDNNHNGRYDEGIDEIIGKQYIGNHPTLRTNPRKPIELTDNSIVVKGAKPKVVETPIPFTTRYEKDPEKPEGEETIVTQGVDGKTVTTTTYEVDPNTGNVTANPSTSTTTPAVEKVVKKGAKPKFESGFGGVVPPVLDVPEYVDPIGGSLDGEGNIVTPPTLGVPEYTGSIGGAGLDGNGGIVPPPVLNVPTYDGVLSQNGEPEVHEKPDFNGGVVPNESVITDVLEYTGPISMNGEPEVHEKPEYNIPKEQPKPKQPKKELLVVLQKQLPNTGDASMFVSATGVVLMGIGALARPRRKK